MVFDEIGLDEEGAAGEFYFLPLPETDDEVEVQHFAAAITVLDDIDEKYLPALFEAMSYINFALPCGAYSIDKDKSFCAFRMTVPLKIDMPGDELYDEMNIVMGNAVTIVDVHMDILRKVGAGEMTAAEVKELL